MYYDMDSIMGRPPVLNPKQTTTSIRLSTDADVFKPDFQAILDTVKYVE